jgi:hypothetical protein
MGWLLVARAAVATAGLDRFKRWIDAGVPRTPAAADWRWRVRRAMSRASRTVPGSSCLVQALAAYALLRRGGHPAELSIGVARATRNGAPIDAHAWVSCGDLVVTGDSELASFTELAQVRSGT